jgi:hypothetical protein
MTKRSKALGSVAAPKASQQFKLDFCGRKAAATASTSPVTRRYSYEV